VEQVPMAMPFMYPPPYGMHSSAMYPGMYTSPGGGVPSGYPSASLMAAGPGGGSYPQGIAMSFYSMPPSGMATGESRYRTPWRVVVHNLPWETTGEELLEAFRSWNPQEAHVMKDRKTGYSKCAALTRD
jgi:hypothetical protein